MHLSRAVSSDSSVTASDSSGDQVEVGQLLTGLRDLLVTCVALKSAATHPSPVPTERAAPAASGVYPSGVLYCDEVLSPISSSASSPSVWSNPELQPVIVNQPEPSPGPVAAGARSFAVGAGSSTRGPFEPPVQPRTVPVPVPVSPSQVRPPFVSRQCLTYFSGPMPCPAPVGLSCFCQFDPFEGELSLYTYTQDGWFRTVYHVGTTVPLALWPVT
jgi:hypothetical protein